MWRWGRLLVGTSLFWESGDQSNLWLAIPCAGHSLAARVLSACLASNCESCQSLVLSNSSCVRLFLGFIPLWWLLGEVRGGSQWAFSYVLHPSLSSPLVGWSFIVCLLLRVHLRLFSGEQPIYSPGFYVSAVLEILWTSQAITVWSFKSVHLHTFSKFFPKR